MLLPVLFPDLWDAAAGRWTVEEPPDLPQAAGFFVAEVRAGRRGRAYAVS